MVTRRNNDRGPLDFRGNAARLIECQAPEVLLSGAAGTGKSVACAGKLHLICSLVPNIRCLMVRKTRESLTEAAMVTFEEKILPPGHPVLSRGGSRRVRQNYTYPNGSTIVLGGMDKPGKVMSAEYDLIYVQEAIELDEPDWEALISRLRNGKLPYQQILADTNPDAPTHWLKRRCDRKDCLLLESYHEDNPGLFDTTGTLTLFGADYLSKLDRLTGPRRDRLRHGKWVQAEGVVYEEWSRRLHLRDRFPIPLDWPRIWGVDFGYTDPFVCLCAARDHDGRLWVYRQVYRTKRLVEDHARHLLALWHAEAREIALRMNVPEESVIERIRPHKIYCDHDPGERATLERYLGAATTPARKEILPGIQAVSARLRQAGDGMPRLLVLRDSLVSRDRELEDRSVPCSLEEEMDSYIWDPDKRDTPVDANNHALDALRYLVASQDLRSAGEVAEVMPVVEVPREEPRLQHGETDRPSRLFGR